LAFFTSHKDFCHRFLFSYKRFLRGFWIGFLDRVFGAFWGIFGYATTKQSQWLKAVIA
jgi:hypothetical protein